MRNSDLLQEKKEKENIPVACFTKNYTTYVNCLAPSVSEPSFLLFPFQYYRAPSSLTQLQLSHSVTMFHQN